MFHTNGALEGAKVVKKCKLEDEVNKLQVNQDLNLMHVGLV
jgi:hypothetical protein